jgi:hypothetical protein
LPKMHVWICMGTPSSSQYWLSDKQPANIHKNVGRALRHTLPALPLLSTLFWPLCWPCTLLNPKPATNVAPQLLLLLPGQ